jgi:hypothetical protein
LASGPLALAQDTKQADTKPAATDSSSDAKTADSKPADAKPTDTKPADAKAAADAKTQALPDVIPQKDHVDVKEGSRDDVEAIGNRELGKRGLGNWYSLESEIRMGKQYAQQIDATVKLVQDPVVTEYVNRIGQNLVRNSDAKVPFTIKVLDTEEVNAFALPGIPVFSYLLLRSRLSHKRGNVNWKGRTYDSNTNPDEKGALVEQHSALESTTHGLSHS